MSNDFSNAEPKIYTDESIDNLYYKTYKLEQLVIFNQHMKWLCKLYLIFLNIKKTIDDKQIWKTDENSYKELQEKAVSVKQVERNGLSIYEKDLPSNNDIYTYWNTINTILSIFMELDGFIIHDINDININENDDRIERFEKKIRSNYLKEQKEHNDIDNLYKYIYSKFSLKYTETVSSQEEINAFNELINPVDPDIFIEHAINRFHNFNKKQENDLLATLRLAIRDYNFTFTPPVEDEYTYKKIFKEYSSTKRLVMSKHNELNRIFIKFFSAGKYKRTVIELISSIDKLRKKITETGNKKKVIDNFKKNSKLFDKKNKIIEDAKFFAKKIIDTIDFYKIPEAELEDTEPAPKRPRIEGKGGGPNMTDKKDKDEGDEVVEVDDEDDEDEVDGGDEENEEDEDDDGDYGDDEVGENQVINSVITGNDLINKLLLYYESLVPINNGYIELNNYLKNTTITTGGTNFRLNVTQGNKKKTIKQIKD